MRFNKLSILTSVETKALAKHLNINDTIYTGKNGNKKIYIIYFSLNLKGIKKQKNGIITNTTIYENIP
ncbi:MAG: hypothetical protein U0K71_12000 [Paludibacteraceae bacterium]|nr:hypothetical protein [Paludibacteraceae bacterium]